MSPKHLGLGLFKIYISLLSANAAGPTCTFTVKFVVSIASEHIIGELCKLLGCLKVTIPYSTHIIPCVLYLISTGFILLN